MTVWLSGVTLRPTEMIRPAASTDGTRTAGAFTDAGRTRERHLDLEPQRVELRDLVDRREGFEALTRLRHLGDHDAVHGGLEGHCAGDRGSGLHAGDGGFGHSGELERVFAFGEEGCCFHVARLRREEPALGDESFRGELLVAVEIRAGEFPLSRGLEVGALRLGEGRALQSGEHLVAFHRFVDGDEDGFDEARERRADDVQLAVGGPSPPPPGPTTSPRA